MGRLGKCRRRRRRRRRRVTKSHELFVHFQYSAFITVILGGQVALCAVTAVYKYEVSFWVASHPPTPR